jgi:hypothetical protein
MSLLLPADYMHEYTDAYKYRYIDAYMFLYKYI